MLLKFQQEGKRESAWERESERESRAVPGFLVSFTSEAGTDCTQAVSSARRDREGLRRAVREEGSSPTRGIAASGVKPPGFPAYFGCLLSPSTLALPSWGFVSFAEPPPVLPGKEEGKRREERREVGSLGERSNWLQPAHSRILFTGSSSSSPAARPQPG